MGSIKSRIPALAGRRRDSIFASALSILLLSIYLSPVLSFHLLSPRDYWGGLKSGSFQLQSQETPANSDASADFDTSELQKRIEQQKNQYLDFMMSDVSDHRPDNVHVIIFNPETPRQGVHAIEFPNGSGNSYVLAFESEDECGVFAKMLGSDAMQGLAPVAAGLPLSVLEETCATMGLPVKMVPSGTHLLPPDINVDDFTMDPWKSQKEPNFADFSSQDGDTEDADLEDSWQ